MVPTLLEHVWKDRALCVCNQCNGSICLFVIASFFFFFSLLFNFYLHFYTLHNLLVVHALWNKVLYTNSPVFQPYHQICISASTNGE